MLAFSLAFAFEGFGLRRENIMLVNVIAIMFIMVETRRLAFGVFSTLFLASVFNFFFTEPRLTFIIDDPDYIISIGIFLITTLTIGTLMTRLQNEADRTAQNVRRVEALYAMSQSLLRTTSIHDMLVNQTDKLSESLDCDVRIFIEAPVSFQDDATTQWVDDYHKEIQYAIMYGLNVGAFQERFQELPILVVPFPRTSLVSGAFLIASDHRLQREETEFMQTVMAHITTVIERNHIIQEEEQSRIKMEKEQLRFTLLRSISHDLRTPLTALKSGTSFLNDSFSSLDDETKRQLLNDINTEASRMNDFVENLLNMTRLRDEEFQIHYQEELIEDVLSEIKRRFATRISHDQFSIHSDHPQSVVVADIPLLLQALTNLVDNAIQHTNPNVHIDLSAIVSTDSLTFEVKDNGPGIELVKLPIIFDEYYSQTAGGDHYRGMGLGLSIVKAIATAHGGLIEAINDPQGGSIFRFVIPRRDRDEI